MRRKMNPVTSFLIGGGITLAAAAAWAASCGSGGPARKGTEQFPDAAAQRNQIIQELRGLNSQLAAIRRTLEAGNLRVRLVDPRKQPTAPGH